MRTSIGRWLAVLAVLGGLIYLAMWIGWRSGWGWLAAVDDGTLAWSHHIGVQHSGWTTFWDVWCTLFSPVMFRLLTAVLIVYSLIRREVRVTLFLLLGIEGSALLTEAMKRLANRPRPETALVDAPSTSFPSGHALGTMVAVLALAVVLSPYVRRAWWPWLAAAGALVVVSVGLGRVALNVHHLSDVVAGWGLGFLYFALCLLVLPRRADVTADETPAAPGIGR